MLSLSFGRTSQNWVSSFFERDNLREQDRAADAGPLRDPVLGQGLIGGTLIATDMGWRPVETLAPGDRVLTFDRGIQPVREIHRAELRTNLGCAGIAQTHIFVPEGAIGNRAALVVLPAQEVLVESDTAEVELGDAFLLIEVQKLVGYKGIRRRAPQAVVTLTTLAFEHEEVVHVCGNALLLCPSMADLSVLEVAVQPESISPYQRLSARSQDIVAGWMQAEQANQARLS